MGNVRNFKKIGILGAGQLAMMLAEASKQLKNPPKIWGNSTEDSACQATPDFSYGPVDQALKFFQNVDTVTLESEFYGEEILSPYRDKLVPRLEHYLELDTKIKEKKLFANLNPVPYSQDFSDIEKFPIMIKLSSGGYDGYGNIVVKSLVDLEELLPKLEDKEIFWEPFLDIKREIATQAVSDGENVVVYPFVETIQKNSICTEVKLLNEKFPELESKILSFVKTKKFVGTLAFEFIETPEETYFNETAPRVHNSGHYTADLCEVGQFKNHMRVCSGLEPAPVKLNYMFGGMINILSQDWEKQGPLLHSLDFESAKYIDYFKAPRLGRKMGHINYWGKTKEEADQTRKKILNHLGDTI